MVNTIRGHANIIKDHIIKGRIIKGHIDKFFRRFFLAYIAMFTISVIAFFILYSRSSSIIENQSIERQLVTLQQSRMRLDDNLTEIMASSILTARNDAIRNILSMKNPVSDTNVIRVREAMAFLRSNQTLNPLLVDFFVVYEHSGLVIAPHTSIPWEDFYTTRVGFDNLSAETWRDDIFHGVSFSRFVPAISAQASMPGTKYNVIQYITPFSSTPHHRGAVVSFIGNNAIYDMFRDAGVGEREAIYIISADGQLISAVSGGIEAYQLDIPIGREGSTRINRNGNAYLVTYTTSPLLNWTYVSVIRSDYVLAELNAFRQALFFVVFTALAVTLILSVVFSLQHTKPIKSLQKTISGYIPTLQYAFLSDIFEGRYYEVDETNSNMKSVGLDLDGSLYKVMVVQLSDAESDRALRYLQALAKIPALIGECVGAQKNKIKFHTVSGRNMFTALFICPGGDRERLGDSVLTVARALGEKSGDLGNIIVGVGGTVTCITEVHKSYTQAGEAIQYYMVHDSSRMVCAYDDIPYKKEFYYYPEQEQQRLLNMVKSGNGEGARATLNAICNENFTNRQLSSNMMVAFINHLWQGIVEIGRLNLIVDQPLTDRLNESYEAFYKLSDLQKLQLTMGLYMEICESLSAHKQNKLDMFTERLKQYVDENYHHPDISLTSLANEHNYSETYLSQRFKEHTGENFYNYVQNLRINKVIALLTTTNLPIQEISERVGYSAYNTFAKAFKRVTGVSAGEYRRTIQPPR